MDRAAKSSGTALSFWLPMTLRRRSTRACVAACQASATPSMPRCAASPAVTLSAAAVRNVQTASFSIQPPFFHQFTHSCTHSITLQALTRSLAHPCIRSFMHACIPFVHWPVRFRSGSGIYNFVLMCSLAHVLSVTTKVDMHANTIPFVETLHMSCRHHKTSSRGVLNAATVAENCSVQGHFPSG